MMMKKCQSCPYKLGIIKTLRDPCYECMMQERKEHPFTAVTGKPADPGRCPKCGGQVLVFGKCLFCGEKIT